MNRFHYLYITLLVLAASVTESLAQCVLEAFPTDTVILTCGRSLDLNLSAYGTTGDYVFNNDFNDQTVGTGWDGTPAVTFTNPCIDSPDGTTYMWMGDATPQPRILTTQSFDFTTGGIICFEMRFSIQADNSPCEGPDEPDEGVALQYSTDNGSTWITLNYYDPIGGHDPTLTSWQQYCFTIPVDAQTASTQIRWFQDETSGEEYDHWGLDNIYISVNDPAYSYDWEHNGYAGPEPPVVEVTSDSMFVVRYGNNSGDVCYDTIFVKTVLPEYNVSTISDTIVCAGECFELTSTSSIMVRQFNQPTFSKTDLEFLDFSPFAVPTNAELTVAGVDEALITASSIESVCINLNSNPSPFGTPFDLSTLAAELECPDGSIVSLVNNGDLSGESLINTCFSNAGATLASGTDPYTGNFLPTAGSYNDLIGCSANGIWTLRLSGQGSLFTQVALDSFNITFNVPELSYEGIHEWTPSTGLDNSSLLSPVACPQATTTYQLLVADSFNCSSVTVPVTIEISETPPCSPIVTSIEDNQFGNDFVIYPNPSNGMFHIDLGRIHERVSMIIRNTLGQTIEARVFESTSLVNSSINGASGLYFIEVISYSGNQAVLKLMKD